MLRLLVSFSIPLPTGMDPNEAAEVAHAALAGVGCDDVDVEWVEEREPSTDVERNRDV